jgi:aldehyde:ferredoxin oxidoreductase
MDDRIATMRQAFNVRDGINAVSLPVPDRVRGVPPLPNGPTAGVTAQIEQMSREFLDDMGWTLDAAVPRREALHRLGLHDVVDDLWS